MYLAEVNFNFAQFRILCILDMLALALFRHLYLVNEIRDAWRFDLFFTSYFYYPIYKRSPIELFFAYHKLVSKCMVDLKVLKSEFMFCCLIRLI